MANQIKDDGVYVFDQDHVDQGKLDTHGPSETILSAITSRYSILGAIISSIGLVILVMTATLQFSGRTNLTTDSSKGVSRQYSISAPRGDIVDCNGVVLATTEQINTLMIANADMEDDKLNAMLLELSYLFDEYNVAPVDDLSDYLSVDPFEWKKSEDEITAWQVSSNLFALKENTTDTLVTYSDTYVKSDPQVFFLYLRSEKIFNIDPSYSTDEAYRIAVMRYQIYKDKWAFSTGTPVKIATDVPDELVTLLLEQNYKYLGIISGKEYRRVYSPLAETSAHVVGYIGKISQERLALLKNFGYTAEDVVGQQGIEAQMERYLHGQSGVKAYNILNEDEANWSFFPENIGTDPVPGANVKLTIDTRIQQVTMDAIKDYIAAAATQESKGYKTASAGSAVMMDVHTGAIISMVSYPNFDPMDFVLSMEGDEQAKEQVKYYLGLGDYKTITAADKPLYNRAIQETYAPGSTFKMVTSLAALETGIISPDDNIYICQSPIDIGGWLFRCHERPDGGHGPLTLERALATSCNIYFQRMGVDTGIDAIDKYGAILGLGELTGIDLPGEVAGMRSSKATKRLLRAEEYDKTWFPADTAQSSIGQFDNVFTTLQLCRYTAALATKTLVTPHVIDEVAAADGTILYTGSTKVEELDISQSSLDAIKLGMRAVITDSEGTANKYLSALNEQIPIACKTGTAETGNEDKFKEYSNGLFVLYAPADDPQIAIAICIEKGEWGASTTVIAEKMLRAYFGLPAPAESGTESADAVIGDVTDTGTATPTPAGSETAQPAA